MTIFPVCNRGLATDIDQPREAWLDLTVASVLPPMLPDGVRLFEDIPRRNAPGSDIGWKKPKARSSDKKKEQETEDADEDAMPRQQHGMGTMRKLASGKHYIFQSKSIEDLSAVEVKGFFIERDVCTVSPASEA